MQTLDQNIPKVLMVDDNPSNLILLKTILEPMGLNFFIATNGFDTLKNIENNDFDLILLDTTIPDIDGYELCHKIKENKKTQDTPILLLSSFSSYEDKMKGFEYGADDYLIKPLSRYEVIARVQLHLQKQITLKRMKQLLKRSYHELFNPLAVIKSSVEMFEIYNEPNKYVKSIHAAAKSLHVIYEDLYYSLSLSKDMEVKKSIYLHEFLSDRVTFFSLLAEIKGMEFIMNVDSSLFVYMTSSNLQRIIDNTISNAIKYAFEDTKIIITLIYNNGIELSVLNQGNNIDYPEDIFTERYREDYDKSGMGIGLEIVASICNKDDIQTMFYSKDNITTFTYTFPEPNVDTIQFN